MEDPSFAGWLWVMIVIIGFAILGLGIAFGTSMWRQRRRVRREGSLERAPGPAPKGAPPSDDDRRAA